MAARHGDWVVMSALLRQGVSINTEKKPVYGDTSAEQHDIFCPLIAAVAFKHKDLIDKILSVPQLNINLANMQGRTALMYAASQCDEDLVLLLLKCGANRSVSQCMSGGSLSQCVCVCVCMCDSIHELWVNDSASVLLSGPTIVCARF